LPLTVGDELVADLLKNGPKLCRFEGRPFIPVEFSDGAYRFGHAQVRGSYDVNDPLKSVPIFPALVGICPVRQSGKLIGRYSLSLKESSGRNPAAESARGWFPL
jgi:hypothetical protein